jgi:site-specific recombinase XerD
MDHKTQAYIEWIENRLKKFHETAAVLEHVIEDYLEWMAVNAYAKSTQRQYKQTLGKFLSFIREGRYLWDEVFTRHTLRRN